MLENAFRRSRYGHRRFSLGEQRLMGIVASKQEAAAGAEPASAERQDSSPAHPCYVHDGLPRATQSAASGRPTARMVRHTQPELAAAIHSARARMQLTYTR